MAEIDTALAASRDAVDEMIGSGERSPAAWDVPRAPGKWSPSQVVEHVAGGLDEFTNFAAGRPPKISRPPAVVRLVLRPITTLLFRRVLRKGVFPTGFKFHKALNPASGPRTPAEGRMRLETAHQEFDEVCRRVAPGG